MQLLLDVDERYQKRIPLPYGGMECGDEVQCAM